MHLSIPPSHGPKGVVEYARTFVRVGGGNGSPSTSVSGKAVHSLAMEGGARLND
jgi:hypothetical protein